MLEPKKGAFCLETCNTLWGQVLANNMWHISRKSHIKEPVYRVTWTDTCTFWTCTTTWEDYCSDGSFAGKVFITENDCIIKQTIPFQKQKMPEDIETADKLIKTVDCLLIEVIFFRSSWEPRGEKAELFLWLPSSFELKEPSQTHERPIESPGWPPLSTSGFSRVSQISQKT